MRRALATPGVRSGDTGPRPQQKNREVIRKNLLTLEGTRWQYTHGVANADSIAPESYTLDTVLLEHLGNNEIQLDLILDYASNVQLYPKFQVALSVAEMRHLKRNRQ